MATSGWTECPAERAKGEVGLSEHRACRASRRPGGRTGLPGRHGSRGCGRLQSHCLAVLAPCGLLSRPHSGSYQRTSRPRHCSSAGSLHIETTSRRQRVPVRYAVGPSRSGGLRLATWSPRAGLVMGGPARMTPSGFGRGHRRGQEAAALDITPACPAVRMRRPGMSNCPWSRASNCPWSRALMYAIPGRRAGPSAASHHQGASTRR